MKQRKIFISLLMCAITSMANSTTNSFQNKSILGHDSTIVIHHVNVLPFEHGQSSNDTILYNQTVIIKREKIVSITPFSATTFYEENSQIVDATGKFLMPGLVDMHTHLFDKSDLPLYLANGVTTVRNMMGFKMHLKWKKQIADGKRIGPSIYTGSPTFNSGNNAGPFHKKVNSEKQIKKAVKKYANAGYDFIKIYDGLDSIKLDLIISEANKYGLSVAGHPPYEINFDDLLTKDIISLEHVEELLQSVLNYKYKENEMRNVANKIKTSNIYITPTLSAYHHILLATQQKEAYFENDSLQFINPVLRFIGKKQLQEWVELENNSNVELKYKIMQMMLKVLDEEGVELLLGTDTGPNLTLPGFELFNEILLSLESGLSSYTVIASGTINAAKALGVGNTSGSVSVGKTADLILVDGNPLMDIYVLQNPYAVIKRGKLIGKDELEKMKEGGKKHNGILVTIARLIVQVGN